MTTNILRTIRTSRYFQLAVLAAVGVVVSLGALSASTSAQTAGNTANSLQVSPVRTDVTMDPGSSKVIQVIVTNPTDEEVPVRVVQNDFVAGDEDGTPAIILEETEEAKSHSLKRFMTPLENIVLGPKEKRAIDVELIVPGDAEAGGYFGSVRFEPAAPSSGSQVNVNASVASLILLTVTGDAPEKLNLTEFLLLQGGRDRTFFTSFDEIVARFRFHNEGNIQAGPFGKISVLRGDKVVYEADFNGDIPRDVVLPDSARRWTVPLEGIDSIGRYTVTATFTYGTKNQSVDISQSFWVIPTPFIIAGIVVVLLVVGGVVALVLRRRRGTKHRPSIGGRR